MQFFCSAPAGLRTLDILYSYQDKVNDTVYKEKLGVYSIKELTKMAKERRAGSLGYAEAMLIIYNKRMKSPLPWNDLYKTKAEKAQANTKAEKATNECSISQTAPLNSE